MSTRIMAAVWPLQMSPTNKAVLVSLADNANDEGMCWPSVATICERTCLSRRAVQGAINWLTEAGYLVATERDGRSNVYQITSAAGAPAQDMHPRSRCAPPAHDMRTPCAAGAPRTVSEPSKEPSLKKRSQVTVVCPPDWIPAQAWISWVEYRKDRRLSCSEKAQQGHIRLLAKLMSEGHSPAEVIQQSIDQGWQGLFPVKGGQPASKPDKYEKRRQFIADLTGQKQESHDDRVIDITPTR